jgi:hypothetical protein
MEKNTKPIELLFESLLDYFKTSVELYKFKIVDKTSEIVSSLISNTIFIVFITIFLFFVNFGLAFWLGDILGKIYYGFFVVAGFYGMLGIVFRYFMHNWFKKIISNSIIKTALK